jgi:hypothetical protein
LVLNRNRQSSQSLNQYKFCVSNLFHSFDSSTTHWHNFGNHCPRFLFRC